jgi:hypothetical protein
MPALAQVIQKLGAATGSDRQLDRDLAELAGASTTEAPDYTSSVDRSVDLLHTVLPGWSWHVGWDAQGIMPYATVHLRERIFEARAATVPIALLRAMTAALEAGAPA